MGLELPQYIIKHNQINKHFLRLATNSFRNSFVMLSLPHGLFPFNFLNTYLLYIEMIKLIINSILIMLKSEDTWITTFKNFYLFLTKYYHDGISYNIVTEDSSLRSESTFS